MELLSSAKCFGGLVNRYSHQSSATQTPMKFHVFVPPQASAQRVPVLYWLSGLTCTDENFITKAGAIRKAAQEGLLLVAPDTSPRGVSIEGDSDSWDFGVSAGFYVDATEPKWLPHYRMYSYITEELPALIHSNFNVDPERQSIFGHSMGGHGALICALKNPGKYKSVSAFAPICNPVNCPWGVKAFTGYLGDNKDLWKQYDATELVRAYKGPSLNILVDQGAADKFLEGQLMPQALSKACEEAAQPLALRLQEGYDHSYWFISTFVEDHIAHHAQFLKQ
eukprot:GILI01023273.1.p1 GENE.GILI01023273.1~~GILI01023273.1.p1  ORF type:complete len:280 (+),score=90.05 GILI01023273.1:91-930(+)